MIQLPAVPESTRPLKPETIMVSLENSKNVENVYHSFLEKKNLDGIPAILFVLFWNQTGRQTIRDCSESAISTLEEAGEAMQRLPSELPLRLRFCRNGAETRYFLTADFTGN